MSEVQETTVMKVARALYELENDQPYVLSWADASKSESMLEYYVEQAECALLASGLPAAIEARDKALELLRALEDSVSCLIGSSEGVYGLHLNGDPAPWSELTEGGAFEDWLLSHSEARAFLASLKEPQQ